MGCLDWLFSWERFAQATERRKPKKSKPRKKLSWEEFLEWFVIYHDEFYFTQGEWSMWLCDVGSDSASTSIKESEDSECVYKDYSSPKEFLEDKNFAARFPDKTFKEVWNSLDDVEKIPEEIIEQNNITNKE